MWELKAADFFQDLPVYEKKPSQNDWGWKGPWRSFHPMGPAQMELPGARCQGPCPESFEFSQEYKFPSSLGTLTVGRCHWCSGRAPSAAACAVYGWAGTGAVTVQSWWNCMRTLLAGCPQLTRATVFPFFSFQIWMSLLNFKIPNGIFFG